MRRIADNIREVAGYAVAKAVDLAAQYGNPLLLLPETFFANPLSRRDYRLAVYAIPAEDAFTVRQGMMPYTDEWLYTDCAYLVYPDGRIYRRVAYQSDCIDP